MSGRRTKLIGLLWAFGEERLIELRLNAQGTVDWTLDELGNMTILCGRCRKPIWVGDAVSLYQPEEDYIVPHNVRIRSQDPLQVLGCMDWECCPSGGLLCGTWMPKPGTTEGFVLSRGNSFETHDAMRTYV